MTIKVASYLQNTGNNKHNKKPPHPKNLHARETSINEKPLYRPNTHSTTRTQQPTDATQRHQTPHSVHHAINKQKTIQSHQFTKQTAHNATQSPKTGVAGTRRAPEGHISHPTESYQGHEKIRHAPSNKMRASTKTDMQNGYFLYYSHNASSCSLLL